MSILSVRHLSKAFGGVHAVDDVSFDVGEGEFLALIGPVKVWMPPSSTMTMASIERDTQATSGEIVPLAKANTPPATPANAPAMAKPIQCTRLTLMPIASARSAESRPARMA